MSDPYEHFSPSYRTWRNGLAPKREAVAAAKRAVAAKREAARASEAAERTLQAAFDDWYDSVEPEPDTVCAFCKITGYHSTDECNYPHVRDELVSAAAEGDPGEGNEPAPCANLRNEPCYQEYGPGHPHPGPRKD